MKTDNYLYIFLHPPRSGGASLSEFFRDHLSPKEKIDIDTYNLSNKTISERKKIRFISGHSTYFGIHKLIPGKKPRYITAIRDPAEWLVSLYQSRMQPLPQNSKQSFEKWYSLQKRNALTLYFDEVFRSTDNKVVLLHSIKRRLRETLDKMDKTRTVHNFLKKLRKRQLPPKTQKIKLKNAKRVMDECWFICITKNLMNDLRFLFKFVDIKENWNKFKIRSHVPGELSILNKKTRQKIYRENPLDLELYRYALKLNRDKKKKLKN